MKKFINLTLVVLLVSMILCSCSSTPLAPAKEIITWQGSEFVVEEITDDVENIAKNLGNPDGKFVALVLKEKEGSNFDVNDFIKADKGFIKLSDGKDTFISVNTVVTGIKFKDNDLSKGLESVETWNIVYDVPQNVNVADLKIIE